MFQPHIPLRMLFRAVLALLSTAGPAAAAVQVHHDLDLRLVPAAHRVMGEDRITVTGLHERGVEIRLGPHASVTRVAVNGETVAAPFAAGRIRLQPAGDPWPNPLRLTVVYDAVYDDPAPDRPVNADDPGYGVSGTVSENGVFLQAGAGWYPQLSADRSTYRIRIAAPAGVVAVTAGRFLGHETAGGQTRSTWQVTRPAGALSLSADRYDVRQRQLDGGIALYTFFKPENADLSAAYLDAAAGFIALYAARFGPYPFEKFAVVENFFPTGYGFPSYTLIGGRVLRLPFVLDTSLGHEIAHCWWGNGVTVKAEGGNWSEGLAAYVADFFYQERRSAAAARDHRLQSLRNYSVKVRPETDMAVDRFRSRYDRVTQSVGYDKSAMIFHMIRRRIGEEAFWGALRTLYDNRRFRPTGWDDFRAAFEQESGENLERFFVQWVHRDGAPVLALDRIGAVPRNGGWRVTGRIVQEKPLFRFPLELVVGAGNGRFSKTVTVESAATPFAIALPERPRWIAADPDHHLFRRLHAAEIPPTVNSLKGAPTVWVVFAQDAQPALRAAARLLVRAMGIDHVRWVEAAELSTEAAGSGRILWIGLPAARGLLPAMPDGVELGRDAFSVDGEAFAAPSDAFFGVFPAPGTAGGWSAVFLPFSAEGAVAAARKIAHYGRYSYLVFSGGRNRLKGTWPATASPLTFRWPAP